MRTLLGRVLEIRRGDPEAHWLLIRCYRDRGAPDDALALLGKMAQAQPNDARVYREMGLIYLQDKHNNTMAQRFITQSLTLDPTQEDLQALTSQTTQQQDDSPKFPGMDIDLPQAPNVNAAMPNIPAMPQMPNIPEMPSLPGNVPGSSPMMPGQ